MADNDGAQPGGSGAPRQPGNNNRGGRGGGRGRGARKNPGEQSAEGGQGQSENRSARRGGRGGNRGGRGGGAAPAPTLTAADLSERFASQPPNEVVAPRPEIAKGKEAAAEGEIDEDAEVCFICASPVIYNALTPCNHRTCHICALRMRALYKTRDCAHCRTESQFVIFTEDPTKRYEDFTDRDFISTDRNIGIRYQTAQILSDSTYFLHYNCPEPTCDIAVRGWPDLHRHVKSVHHKKMCDLCSRNKKVFTHEHELFTDKELQKHMSKGDDNPGAVDQSGFKGHPLCSFCGQRFYGDDELYIHCRDKHERCFLCDRADSRRPHYYIDYRSLEDHFRADHYMCLDRACQEKKFVVFGSEMDLKAHQLEEHKDSLSKDVRRDARVVDMASFDYRAPYVTERRAGESQRDRQRGRGRDPNAEPIPASSAQPMGRAEQAFQRQMAIHSAQSVTTRTFGGQLTAPTPAQAAAASSSNRPTAASSSSRPGAQQRAAPVESVTHAVADLDLSPQEQARRQQHGAVIEKATRMLGNDNLKVTQFRNALSSYRTNGITASGLIDSFFALFTDTASSALGTLVRDVADLYEDKKKAEGIRTAWNDWRAINEDYPSLPGPSGMTGNASSGWSGIAASMPANVTIQPAKARVLKLKSSTTQSSRANASTANSSSSNPAWANRISTPLVSNARSSEAFPGLPASGSSIKPTPKISTQPWAPPAAAASSSNRPSPRPTPPPSRPASRVTGGLRGGASGGDFPALPAAPKPVSTIFGYGRGMVRRDNGTAPSASAWGGGASAEEPTAAEETQTRKKGNKGKKNVLLAWG